MRAITFFFSLIIAFICCKGQDQGACSNTSIIDKIKKLPESIKDSIQLFKQKKTIVYQVWTDTFNRKNYKVIKQAVEDDFHLSTLQLYYVDQNCNIFKYDTVKDSLFLVNTKQKKMNNNINPIEFSDLFKEGSNIKFTPYDLNKDIPEIKEFKAKLISFESTNPSSDDFDLADLSLLINDMTFINNESYIDSSWLGYFIRKFNISSKKIYALTNLAIKQEDVNAVIILKQNYIVSQVQLKEAEEKSRYVKSLNGKIDTNEYYDPSFSKISEIEIILKKSYSKNHIQDNDGYSNLRKDKNSASEILQKIKSGEHIDVLDNTGDWYLIKSKEGKLGYVHKSRISAE